MTEGDFQECLILKGQDVLGTSNMS